MQRDKVLVRGSPIQIKEDAALLPDDGQVHEWTIAFDGVGKLIFAMDQIVIASFEGLTGYSSGADAIKIVNTSMNGIAGHNEVYLDRLKLTVGALPESAHIGGLSVLPDSDAQQVTLGVELDDIPPSWLSGGELKLRMTLMQHGQMLCMGNYTSPTACN